MNVSTSRARRRALALATAIAALTTLAACADEQPLTAPSTTPNAPGVAAEVAPTAEDDSTRLAITIDPVSRFFYDGNGAAVITGKLTCSRVVREEIILGVRVEQRQPGNVVGDGSGEQWFTCLTPGVQDWYVYVPAYSGYFDPGKARVSLRLIERSSGIVPMTLSARVTLDD
jgi:predicted small lipoprotein YifL